MSEVTLFDTVQVIPVATRMTGSYFLEPVPEYEPAINTEIKERVSVPYLLQKSLIFISVLPN